MSQAIVVTTRPTKTYVVKSSTVVDTGVPGDINIATLTSDCNLVVGQSSYIDVVNATSIPLKTAFGNLQQYTLVLDLNQTNGGAPGNPILNPNNTTYTNLVQIEQNDTNNSWTPSITYGSGFPVGGSFIQKSVTQIFTQTAFKAVQGTGMYLNATNYVLNSVSYLGVLGTVASTASVPDSTTPWTSAGTLTFSTPATGRIRLTRTA